MADALGRCLPWIIIVLLPCSVFTDEETIAVTSSCAVSNNTLVRDITNDNSYYIKWGGEFPFTSQSFCRINFARIMTDAGIVCIKLSDSRFTTDDLYVKLYTNNETSPMKTFNRRDVDYNEDSVVKCGEYFMITVEIGGDPSTTSSVVSGSHIVVNIYPEIVEAGSDDDGVNRWVIISIALTVGMTFISIAIAVGCWCVRLYCVSRIQQQDRQARPPHVVYQPNKI